MTSNESLDLDVCCVCGRHLSQNCEHILRERLYAPQLYGCVWQLFQALRGLDDRFGGDCTVEIVRALERAHALLREEDRE